MSKFKKVFIEIEIDNEDWRTNEDLEDSIESTILDNIDSVIDIDVSVKNGKKTN